MKVVERQCLAVLPVGVVIFRDDARLFPSSARAPGLCHATALSAARVFVSTFGKTAMGAVRFEWFIVCSLFPML